MKDKISFLDKLLIQFFPKLGIKHMANKQNISSATFDKLHEVLQASQRVDLFSLNSNEGRGFMLVLDQNTALYFYQNGDHFIYDGFEIGKYGKGDVALLDNYAKKVSPYL